MVYPQTYRPREGGGGGGSISSGGRTSGGGGFYQQEPLQQLGSHNCVHRSPIQSPTHPPSPFREPQQAHHTHRSPITSPTRAHYSPVPSRDPDPTSTSTHSQSQQFESRSLATTHTTKTRTSRSNFKSPFPSWVTQLFRALLAIIEVGAMGFGCFFLVKWQPAKSFPTARYELSVATVGVALALDLSALILATCRKYGLWWMIFVVLADGGIGIMGVLGVVRVYSSDGMDGRTEEDLGWKWAGIGKLVGLFGVICGAFHILFAFLGCIGCIMVQTSSGRRRPR